MLGLGGRWSNTVHILPRMRTWFKPLVHMYEGDRLMKGEAVLQVSLLSLCLFLYQKEGTSHQELWRHWDRVITLVWGVGFRRVAASFWVRNKAFLDPPQIHLEPEGHNLDNTVYKEFYTEYTQSWRDSSLAQSSLWQVEPWHHKHVPWHQNKLPFCGIFPHSIWMGGWVGRWVGGWTDG